MKFLWKKETRRDNTGHNHFKEWPEIFEINFFFFLKKRKRFYECIWMPLCMWACVCVCMVWFHFFAMAQHASQPKVETINNADTNRFFSFEKLFHLDLSCKNRLHLYFWFALAMLLFYFLFFSFGVCLLFVSLCVFHWFIRSLASLASCIFQIGLVAMVTVVSRTVVLKSKPTFYTP